MKNLSSSAQSVLQQAVDIREIIKNHPGVIDITRLHSTQKVLLLREGDDDLTNLVLSSKLDSHDIFTLVSEMPKSFLKKHSIGLTLENVKKLDSYSYAKLLVTDIEKYFIPEKWEKVSNSSQTDIFLGKPEYFFKNKIAYPKLTKRVLRNIKAEVIDQYFDEAAISKFTMDFSFWEKMINFKSIVYKPMFIRLMSKSSSATEIRSVFWRYPDLIKMVKMSDLENNKLTLKQWVLLFNAIVKKEAERAAATPRRNSKPHVNIFDGWRFDQEFVADMELSLTLEMLNGKSKVTKQFTNAMAFVKTLKIMDEEDETETV